MAKYNYTVAITYVDTNNKDTKKKRETFSTQKKLINFNSPANRVVIGHILNLYVTDAKLISYDVEYTKEELEKIKADRPKKLIIALTIFLVTASIMYYIN